MGAGIAYSCARAGIDVVLKDVTAEAAERGQGLLREAAATRRVARGRTTQREARTRCWPGSPRPPTPPTSRAATPVIEAVFEDAGAQAQGLPGDRSTSSTPDALLCSNTSTLPITVLADGVERPRRLHRPALLLARRQDAAGRDHQGRADRRRGAGPRLRPGPADPQDPDRGQRLARLLHLPRHRPLHQRGRRDGRRGRRPRRPSSRPPPRPATRPRCSRCSTS